MCCLRISRIITPNVLIKAKATSSCFYQCKRSPTLTRRSSAESGSVGSSNTIIARPHEYFDRTTSCGLLIGGTHCRIALGSCFQPTQVLSVEGGELTGKAYIVVYLGGGAAPHHHGTD